MSKIHRRAARRDQNESEIIEALRTVGATVTPLSDEGVPDLLVGFRGETYLMEVKKAKGKLTEAQVEYHEDWQGSPIHIVRSMEEALKAVGAIS